MCPDTDQRGVDRVDAACDIGAFESDVPSPALANLSIALSAAKTTQNGKQLTYTIIVTNSGPNSAENVMVNDLLPTGVVYVANGLK